MYQTEQELGQEQKMLLRLGGFLFTRYFDFQNRVTVNLVSVTTQETITVNYATGMIQC